MKSRARAVDAVLLGALMLATLGLRLATVEDYPFSEDELLSITAMESIVETGVPTRETGQLYGRAPLAHYLMAVPLLFSEPGAGPARLVPIVLSVLVLPVVFLMGRRLAGRWAGLLAALFLAFSDYENAHAAMARFYMPFQFFFLCAVHLAASHLILRTPSRGVWLLGACIAAAGSCRFSVELVPTIALALLLGRRWELVRSGRFWAAVGIVFAALWVMVVYRPGHLDGSVMVPLSLGSVTDPWFFAEQFRRWAPAATTLLVLAGLPLCVGPRAGTDRRLWAFHLGAFVGPLAALSLVGPGDAGRYMSNLFPLGVVVATASGVWTVREGVRLARDLPRLRPTPRAAGVALVLLAAVGHALAFENWALADGFGREYRALDQKPAHDVLVRELRPGDLVVSTTPGLTSWYLGRPPDFILRERYDDELGRFVPFDEAAKRNALSPLLDSPKRFERFLEQESGRVWLYANYKLTFTASREMLEVIAAHFEPVHGYRKDSGSVLFVRKQDATALAEGPEEPRS